MPSYRPTHSEDGVFSVSLEQKEAFRVVWKETNCGQALKRSVENRNDESISVPPVTLEIDNFYSK